MNEETSAAKPIEIRGDWEVRPRIINEVHHHHHYPDDKYRDELLAEIKRQTLAHERIAAALELMQAKP